MITLIIDTATEVLGVALLHDDTVIEMRSIDAKRSTSELLLPTIKQIMEENKIKQEELNSIVVCEGPGSFTGTRIGITFAKVFVLSRPNVSLYKVNALWGEIGSEEGFAFLDARSQKVFGAMIRNNEMGPIKIVSKDQLPDSTEIYGDSDIIQGALKPLSRIENIVLAKSHFELVNNPDLFVPLYIE